MLAGCSIANGTASRVLIANWIISNVRKYPYSIAQSHAGGENEEVSFQDGIAIEERVSPLSTGQLLVCEKVSNGLLSLPSSSLEPTNRFFSSALCPQ